MTGGFVVVTETFDKSVVSEGRKVNSLVTSSVFQAVARSTKGDAGHLMLLVKLCNSCCKLRLELKAFAWITQLFSDCVHDLRKTDPVMMNCKV